MKQFLLFAGSHYYPSGGWADFVKDFNSLEAALAHNRQNYDWWHVVDITTGKVVIKNQ